MKATFVILLLLITTELYCQKFVKKESVILEIGGSAGVGSINYESVFSKKGKANLLWRAGVSGLPIDKNNGFVFIILTTFGTLIGQGNNKLELGIGQGLSVTSKGKISSLATPIIGYRYQNAKKRLFFRITYTPLISYILDFQYQNWAGVSLGYNLSFK